MAVLTVATINEAGAVLTLSSAASGDGDSWANTGNQQILVKNASGGSVTVTVTTQVTDFESPQYGDATKTNTTLAIATDKIALVGPFPSAAYNDSNGYCHITYSAVTNVEVGVFEIQK